MTTAAGLHSQTMKVTSEETTALRLDSWQNRWLFFELGLCSVDCLETAILLSHFPE